jgi:hypothetical protein
VSHRPRICVRIAWTNSREIKIGTEAS